MFSILFVLISRTPLFFLKAISFFIYIFARTLKVSHLNITKKNIDHCFGDNKELVNKSFRETMELSLIFSFIWGKKDNYKNYSSNNKFKLLGHNLGLTKGINLIKWVNIKA